MNVCVAEQKFQAKSWSFVAEKLNALFAVTEF